MRGPSCDNFIVDSVHRVSLLKGTLIWLKNENLFLFFGTLKALKNVGNWKCWESVQVFYVKKDKKKQKSEALHTTHISHNKLFLLYRFVQKPFFDFSLSNLFPIRHSPLFFISPAWLEWIKSVKPTKNGSFHFSPVSHRAIFLHVLFTRHTVAVRNCSCSRFFELANTHFKSN